MKMNATKLGMAFAATGMVMYLGCMLLMAILGTDRTIWFFNSILHGFETESIVRMDVSMVQTGAGIVLTGLIAWFVGWLVGMVYNRLLN